MSKERIKGKKNACEMTLRDVFKNPEKNEIRIKKVSELSEKEVGKLHDEFCFKNGILFYDTQAMGKGQIHSTKSNGAFIKSAVHAGFFDRVFVIRGRIIGVELKSGKGGYLSQAQQQRAAELNAAGGLSIVTNDLSKTKEFLKTNKLFEE